MHEITVHLLTTTAFQEKGYGMEDSSPSAFGECLKAFRKRSKLTQQGLADRIGVHRNTIGSWEQGTFLPESKTIVLELARHLQLNAEDTRRLLEASLTALSPYWAVPYQRNPFFTGRDEVLLQIHAALAQERASLSTRSYALTGLGGIGKTQTALEYAYRYAQHYSAVFWISAETTESLFSSLLAIAEVLGLPEQRDQDQRHIVAALIRWLTGHGHWLLILDNVEDVEQVKSLLPAARDGSLLFTTRRKALALAAQTQELEPMTPEEGVRFLLQRARRAGPTTLLAQVPPQEVGYARELVATMQGLPLALDQAGAYMEATGCSLSDYVRLFDIAPLRLLDERDASDDHPLSVTRTVALAFEQLEQRHPLAAELLTVCAFLAPEAIPEAFFIEGAVELGRGIETLASHPFELQQAIKALLAYSLVQRQATIRTLTIHRLVQTILKGRLSEASQRLRMGQVLHAMSRLFPAEEMQEDYWSACERLLPHALACLTWHTAETEETVLRATLMCHVASYLSNRARFAEAEPLFAQARGIAEQALGQKHPLMARILYGLATLYADQDKLAEAETLYEQALHIREQVLGADHPAVAVALNMLAEVYRKQGRYSQAEPLYQQAIDIRQRRGDLDCPQGAALLNNLALLYWHQERRTEAELLYEQAWRIWEQTLGPEHPQVAFALNNLAILYAEQGRYAEAEPLFERALSIRRHTLGPEHPQVAYPLNNLAELYSLQGRYEQAEPLYQQALEIWEHTLGPEHPQLAHPLSGLADLSNAQGKLEEARRLYERALAIRQQSLGPRHPLVAESLYALAQFYQAHQRPQEALPLYQQALTIRREVFGQEHPKVVEVQLHLALLLQQPHVETAD
jgi:tetratricopeptide (TPR) repeat protein